MVGKKERKILEDNFQDPGLNTWVEGGLLTKRRFRGHKSNGLILDR